MFRYSVWVTGGWTKDHEDELLMEGGHRDVLAMLDLLSWFFCAGFILCGCLLHGDIHKVLYRCSWLLRIYLGSLVEVIQSDVCLSQRHTCQPISPCLALLQSSLLAPESWQREPSEVHERKLGEHGSASGDGSERDTGACNENQRSAGRISGELGGGNVYDQSKGSGTSNTSTK